VARKTKFQANSWRVVGLGTVLFVALGIGLITVFKMGADQQRAALPQATGRELEASYTDIATHYLAQSSTECADVSDPVSPENRVAVFYRYLRVNIHNSRAVIRGCNNIDTLLARIDGKWLPTNVNMNLDAAANPVWQQACDITDITRADTVKRPENDTIDDVNLKMCEGLQRGKILQLQDL